MAELTTDIKSWDKPLECPRCGRVYSVISRKHFNQHVKACGMGTFACQTCGATFSTSHTLKRHMNLHIKADLFTCRICKKSFVTKFACDSHMKTHIDISERTADRIKCDFCEKTFQWKSSLSRHLETHQLRGTYRCACDSVYTKYVSFRYHTKKCLVYKNQGALNSSEESDARVGEKVIDLNDISDIQQAETNSPVHQCQFCHTGFKNRKEFDKHVDICDTVIPVYKQSFSKEAKLNTKVNRIFVMTNTQNKGEEINDKLDGVSEQTVKVETGEQFAKEDARLTNFDDTYSPSVEKSSVDDSEYLTDGKSNVNIIVQKRAVPRMKNIRPDGTEGQSKRHDSKQHLSKTLNKDMLRRRTQDDNKLTEKNDLVDKESAVRRSCRKVRRKQFPDFNVEYNDKRSENVTVLIQSSGATCIQDPDSPMEITEITNKASDSVLEQDIKNVDVTDADDDITDFDFEAENNELDEMLKSAYDSDGESDGIMKIAANKKKNHSNVMLNVALKCTETDCQKVLFGLSQLQKHKQKKHKEKLKFTCLHCDKSYTLKTTLHEHLSMCHYNMEFFPLTFHNAETVDTNLEIQMCTKCRFMCKTSTNRSQLPTHVCSPKALQYFCPFCKNDNTQAQFAVYDECFEHIQKQHAGCTDHSAQRVDKYVNLKSSEMDPALKVGTDDTKCWVCQLSCTSSSELKAHVNAKHASHPYCCGLCRQAYGRRTSLTKHMAAHHPKEICRVCKKGFYDKQELTSHMTVHSGKKPEQCEHCQKRFCNKSSLVKHLQRVHSIDLKEPSDASSICDICGKIFQHPNKLKTHMLTHQEVDRVTCEYCFQVLKKDRFESHKQKCAKHKQDRFYKVVVPQDLASKKSLYQTLVSYNPFSEGDRNFKCLLCSSAFRTRKFAVNHLNRCHTFSNRKKLVCDLCNKGFTRELAYKIHMRSHSGAKPYKCRICGKLFRQVGHVREHLRSHSEVIFQCHYCPLKFKTRQTLLNHVKVHCKIQPFICMMKQCCAAFKTTELMLQHFKTCATQNIGEKDATLDISCKHCNQSFINRIEANEHAVAHAAEGLNVYPCETCSEKFATYKKLYQHMDNKKHFTDSNEENRESSEIGLEDGANGTEECSGTNRNFRVEQIKWDGDLENLLNQYDYISKEDIYENRNGNFGQSDKVHKVNETRENQNAKVGAETSAETSGHQSKNLLLLARHLTNNDDSVVDENPTEVVQTANEEFSVMQTGVKTKPADSKLVVEVSDPEYVQHIVLVGSELDVHTVDVAYDTVEERVSQVDLDLNQAAVLAKTKSAAENTASAKTTEIQNQMFSVNVSHLDHAEKQSVTDSVDKGSIELTQPANKAVGLEQKCRDRQKEKDHSTFVVSQDMERSENILDVTSVDYDVGQVISLQEEEEQKDTFRGIEQTGNLEQNKASKPLENAPHVDSVTRINTRNLANTKSDLCKDNISERGIQQSETTADLHSDSLLKNLDACISNEVEKANGSVEGVKTQTEERPQNVESEVTNVEQPIAEIGTYLNANEKFGSQNIVANDPTDREGSKTFNPSETVLIYVKGKDGQKNNTGRIMDSSGEEILVLDENGGLINLSNYPDLSSLKLDGVTFLQVDEADLESVNASKGLQLEVESADFIVNMEDNQVAEDTLEFEREKQNITDKSEIKGRVKCTKVKNLDQPGHKVEHHSHVCKFCGRSFSQLKHLNFHKKSHLQSSEQKYKCLVCSQGFTLPSQLRAHQRKHTGERPFECSLCGKCFKQTGHLQTHIKKHRGDYNYSCQYCGKKYITNSQLKAHVKNVHFTEESASLKSDGKGENWSCGKCGNVFLDEADLRNHQLDHLADETQTEFLNKFSVSGVNIKSSKTPNDKKRGTKDQKKQICDICGETLNRLSLANHVALHKVKEGKLYQCKLCFRKFFDTPQGLDEHEKLKHKDSIQCDQCGIEMKSKVQLHRHLKTAHSERSIQCSKCLKEFVTKTGFVNHLSVCFGEEFKSRFQKATM